MAVHVLAGDSLANDVKETGITGEMIVCREALVDGPVKADSLDEFWELRANHLEGSFDEPGKYYVETVPEFEKIINLPDGSEVNLWFEYELFCQVNMWFVLSLLGKKDVKVFRGFPSVRTDEEKWLGFGGLNSGQLMECFSDRVEFTNKDIHLGVDLWDAYRNEWMHDLMTLPRNAPPSFPYLAKVCIAEIERKRDQRPEKILRDITTSGATDFGEIFQQFRIEGGVYGFGDTQVKNMLERLNV